MSEDRKEIINKLRVESRLLEQTAEAIQARVNMLNAVIADLTYANMTLEGLEKTEGNLELLVPIGGNSYIKAKLESKETIILGIGAGISLEKKSEEAKIIVKTRLENLEKAKASLQQQSTEVVKELGENREKFEKLTSDLNEEKTS